MTEVVTRRRAETQARLLAAAVGVFADKGVLAATVEEICDRAGFTRGAFYSNFASKDELVLALLNRGREETTTSVARLTSDSARTTIRGTREDAIRAALEFVMNAQTTERDWILVSAEIRLYAAREPGIRAAYLAFQDSFRSETVAALRSVVERYGLELSLPVPEAVEMLSPVYEACMLDALLSLPAVQGTDVKGLDPQALAKILQPMFNLLNGWIVTVRGLPAGIQP